MKATLLTGIGTAAMVAIAAVFALRSQTPPTRPLPPSQTAALSGDLRRKDDSALVVQARARQSKLRVHVSALGPPARPTTVEQPEPRAGSLEPPRSSLTMRECWRRNWPAASSTVTRQSNIAEHLITSRARETEYVASVAQLLANSLQSSLAVDAPGASELAYTTLVGQLLDGGDAESAQYLAQEALTQSPESTGIRVALATALAERLYYHEAIGVLREIREPDATHTGTTGHSALPTGQHCGSYSACKAASRLERRRG